MGTLKAPAKTWLVLLSGLLAPSSLSALSYSLLCSGNEELATKLYPQRLKGSQKQYPDGTKSDLFNASVTDICASKSNQICGENQRSVTTCIEELYPAVLFSLCKSLFPTNV